MIGATPPSSICTGANRLPGKGAGGCGSLRPTPGKAYFSVEGRKLFAGKRRRRLREFAPRSRESLILPSRAANPSPGNPPGASVSLRPPPGKALLLR